VLVERTGQPQEKIVADMDRDFILRGDDAVAYGMVDEIIHRRRPRPSTGFLPPEPAAVGAGNGASSSD
jgi:ATP-dependent protease ClpP protease subunit